MGNLIKSVKLRKIRHRAEFPASTKNSNTHCAGCGNVNVAKRACDQCSIFSTVQ